MKYLGVDYGTKKVGLAVSNDEGIMAFPRDILLRDKNTNLYIEQIQNLCKIEGISDIVIGKSVDFDNKDNAVEKHITEFIDILNRDNLYTIHRIDERMTTSQLNAEHRFHFQKQQNSKNFSKNAKSVREHTKDDDAKVAALILQSFLDSKPKL